MHKSFFSIERPLLRAWETSLLHSNGCVEMRNVLAGGGELLHEHFIDHVRPTALLRGNPLR